MFDDLISRASSIYGVPQSWIRGFITVESSWRPGAVSPMGAIGLMQIMPSTGALYGVIDPQELYLPDKNIDIGTHLLADLRTSWGDDLYRIASAYNSGKPDYYLTNPKIAAYADKVIAAIEGYLATEPVIATSGASVLLVFFLMWLWARRKKKK